MSTPTEQAVEVLCQYLQEQELPARTAWPVGSRPELEAPVIAVSLRGCESAPAGFSGYLGQRLNPDTQAWEERYGKTVKLTFGLDLYAAPGTGAMAASRRAASAVRVTGYFSRTNFCSWPNCHAKAAASWQLWASQETA